MTKLDLQKELLEKVKPGMKPSDIKRRSQKPSQISQPPPPMSLSKSDDGYSSSEEKNFADQKTADPKDLQNQITSLKKQLQLYKDFKEADLKVKEKLKEENKLLKEKIANLQKAKPTAEPQPQEVKTFLCSDCQQTKPSQELSRVFGDFSFCLECSKKARKQAQQEKSKPEEFTCHACQQTKSEIPAKMKLDSTLTDYLVCQPCRPNLKEFNEADLITDELWEKYPYSSASEILEKEFNIKKEEPW